MEERRRKQHVVLFGPTDRDRAAAEAELTPRQRWEIEQAAEGYPANVKVIVNDVPRDMHMQLQQIAVQNGMSLSQLGRVALELLLQRAHEGTLPKLPTWPADPAQG